MPMLSSKRQITLPKELCDRLGIRPGDDLLLLEHEGRITILKRTEGRSAGFLKHVKADARYTDAQSRESAIEERRKRGTRRRRSPRDWSARTAGRSRSTKRRWAWRG